MKGSEFNEKNISAKEKTRTEGAWLQKENVNKKRKKGFGKTPCKRQKAAFLLIKENTKKLCVFRANLTQINGNGQFLIAFA